VNNDAITLAELQENVVHYRQENKDETRTSDEELTRQFLTRLIDNRVQLQEADREKITVDEAELDEELAERVKKSGVATIAELETMLRAQGVALETVKQRLRETLKIAKVIRRKVAARVSITEGEIDRYLDENRAKLEAGLAYHARHILIVPDPPKDDAAWEAARIRADMLRKQILEGADFTALAREHSQDASAKDGGDLGTLRRGELTQDIEAQILALEPGQLSPPYRSALGYHVFRIESKEGLEGDTLTRARQQVREILFRQKYEARFAAWLREIKERAVIEIRM
jgi:peptidyl-prolyl cis-trans isomerase SurA